MNSSADRIGGLQMPVAREPFTATAVIADATEVIAAAEAISFDVPRDRYVHVLYGVGALAYSRAHLLAMVALAHARRQDVVGLHVRAIFEHVVYGAIVVWGNPDDLDRLAANERHHFNRMAKHLDGLDAEDGDARPWNLWDQCVRADALIGNRPAEPPNAMIDWYNRVYRGVSLISTHAGTMSTSRYAPMRPDGTFSIVFDPNEEALGLGQVYMGCRLTDVLAGWIREVCAPAS